MIDQASIVKRSDARLDAAKEFAKAQEAAAWHGAAKEFAKAQTSRDKAFSWEVPVGRSTPIKDKTISAIKRIGQLQPGFVAAVAGVPAVYREWNQAENIYNSDLGKAWHKLSVSSSPATAVGLGSMLRKLSKTTKSPKLRLLAALSKVPATAIVAYTAPKLQSYGNKTIHDYLFGEKEKK